MTDWYYQSEEVLNFGKILKEKGKFETVDQVFDYFEKPWKWDQEWNEYQKEQDNKK